MIWNGSPGQWGPATVESPNGAAVTLMRQRPELEYHHGFPMVYQWLLSGAKTAFLQDANSLIMKRENLVPALRHLRKTFPSINRVTSYARSKTVAKKEPGDPACHS